MVGEAAVRSQIDGTSAGIHNQDTRLLLWEYTCQLEYAVPSIKTYSVCQCQSVRKTKVESGFAFGDKIDARTPSLRVGYQTSPDGGLPHPCLLRPTPVITVSQDEDDVIFEACTDFLPV